MLHWNEFRGDLLIRLSNGRVAVAWVYAWGEVDPSETEAVLDLEAFLLELWYKAWATEFIDWYEFAYHFQGAKRLKLPKRCTEDITYHWQAEYRKSSIQLAAEVGVANQDTIYGTRAKFTRPFLYFSRPIRVQGNQKPSKWAWVRIITPVQPEEGRKERIARELISYAQACNTQGKVLHLNQIETLFAPTNAYQKYTNPKTGITTFHMVENRDRLIVRIHP